MRKATLMTRTVTEGSTNQVASLVIHLPRDPVFPGNFTSLTT